MIQVGSKVNVHFANDAKVLTGAMVKSMPLDVGDCWVLVMPDGKEVCVILFSYMEEAQCK